MKDDKSAQSPSATGSDSTSAQSPSATDSDSKSAQSPSATGSKSAGSDAGMTGQQFVNTQTSGQWLASDMIGMEVVGSNNEDIGSVSDLLVDNEGNILAAVVGVGGFLGIGQKNVAITFDALNLTNKDGEPAASLTLTKEELEGAPEFKSAARAKSDAQRQSAPGSPVRDASRGREVEGARLLDSIASDARPELFPEKEKPLPMFDGFLQ